ncbi:MAG: ECF transporter S component, partial [Ruminococcaceae bacterium]|nr:ECF transporter S component [Oscillospiraceae bacterium]
MAALTFVFTMFFRIDIPTPLGKTMLHLGNVMCLLSGLLFGPVRGGLAGGIGSMMYDLFDP